MGFRIHWRREREGNEPSLQTVGILFHETAERAEKRGYSSKNEWKALAARIASVRGDEHALDLVEDCIDRYYETDVVKWDTLAAERPFELEFDGETIVGQVDALYRRPDGELAVLDYKATSNERSLESDLQLPIYLLACRTLFEEPVKTAGYVYVGETGPNVSLRTFSDAELEEARERVTERVAVAADSSFEGYTAGPHCQWCPHRSLSCSDEADIDGERVD